MTAEQKWFLQPISVPLQKERLDPSSVQAAADAIVSKNPRSFEVFWNGSELELCFGSSTAWDLDLALRLYRQHVKVGLSEGGEMATATARGGGSFPVPQWLPKLDPSRARFFFVGNEEGHCFAAFETRKTGLLMTPLLISLHRSRLAWVQFEWFEADLHGHLGDLRWRLAERHEAISRPIESRYPAIDSAGNTYTKTEKVENPAMRGEFHTFYPNLSAHIEAKTRSRLSAMIVRGVVNPGEGGVGELPFGMIEDTGEVGRGRWLGSPQSSGWGGESKLGDSLRAWWTGDPRMLLDMVQRRAFDVRGPMESYVNDYLPWRHSLPFVILGREEMGLLIHPPSSDLRGLRTTRGSELPPPSPTRMAGKQGIQIAG